jgi:creatinine amidohydrolase
MTEKVRWEEMFPDELDAALARCPVVYLAYGLCEPHGLHNAVGMDAIKAHGIAVRAAEAHGGIVAPPYYWHIHEIAYEAPWSERHIGDRNPWLTAIPPWVLFHDLWYHLRNAAARGFKAGIVLTGHCGSPQDFKLVCDIFMRHSPLRIWAGSNGETITLPDVGEGHAGASETSQLMALCPELVDLSRIPPGSPEEINRIMATGRDARESSRAFGEAIVASEVAFLGERAAELLAAWRPPERPASRHPGNPLGALTFGEAERLWRAEVEPLLPQFDSLNRSPGAAPVDPASTWAPNEMSHAALFGVGP